MSILLSLISYCTVWKLYERCFGPSNFNSNTTLSRVEVNVFISTHICTHTKMQYCNVYTGIKRCSHSDTPPSTLQVNCLLTSCLFDDSGVIESLGDQKKNCCNYFTIISVHQGPILKPQLLQYHATYAMWKMNLLSSDSTPLFPAFRRTLSFPKSGGITEGATAKVRLQTQRDCYTAE